MPGMNGFEFVQHVKDLAPSTKVFLMTAYEITNRDVEMALPSIKVDEFLKKPFDLEALGKMVQHHLEQT
jgi:DNA-binding NtrC family response regulator